MEEKNSWRLNQFIAQNSDFSRRDADRLIFEGKVKVNGEIVTSPGVRVSSSDKVVIEGQVLTSRAKVLYLFNKPAGYVVSTKDFPNQPSIYNLIPKELHYLQPIGRLDQNSEGLLLLTNDGEFNQYLTKPSNAILREYEVKVFSSKDNIAEASKQLGAGIIVEGAKYKPIKLKMIKQTKHNYWLQFTLTEGKNREIRNICQHFGWNIAYLKRIAFGEYKLGELPSGGLLKV